MLLRFSLQCSVAIFDEVGIVRAEEVSVMFNIIGPLG